MKTINQIIKSRKTQKVLAEQPLPITSTNNSIINELLELAAAAPYHFKCCEEHKNEPLNSCLPWRSYTLDAKSCRLLLEYIEQNEIKTGKIANLLAAADALIITTWLPDEIEKESSESEPLPFIGSIRNMEHIAAASAAIQNILLGATARDIPNYWSSGGKLRANVLRDFLEIPLSEILLGAIFLFPKNSIELGVQIKDGAVREHGKEVNTWSKAINL